MITLDSILENEKDLTTYEKLLKAFADYTTAFPATGCDTMFNILLNRKTAVIPKDKDAVKILDYVLGSKENAAGIVQQILNMRFCDLPVECKPMYEHEAEKKVACWKQNDVISDKVVSLLDLGQKGKIEGFVCCYSGEKVKLLATVKE